MKMALSEDFLRTHMERCIDIAIRTGNTIAKPHVGALIVNRKGRIIADGGRRYVDKNLGILVHAERDAINNSTEDPRGAILFTTLEPCIVQWVGRHSHRRSIFKPCAELIAENCIGMVVYGLGDINSPSHEGLSYLTNRGVTVIHYDALTEKIIDRLMSYRVREFYDVSDK